MTTTWRKGTVIPVERLGVSMIKLESSLALLRKGVFVLYDSAISILNIFPTACENMVKVFTSALFRIATTTTTNSNDHLW